MALELDFSLLPPIDSCDVFIRLARDVEEGFKRAGHFTETYCRARGATMLFCSVAGHTEAWHDEAFIRAGLSEFRSVEQTASREHKLGECPGRFPAIADSKNPLLHLMLLLRHATVHTRSVETSRHDTSVISTFGGDAHEVKYTTSVLTGIDVEQLLERRETRQSYVRSDLEGVAEWFLERQQTFGCHEVFRAGVDIYCREILVAS